MSLSRISAVSATVFRQPLTLTTVDAVLTSQNGLHYGLSIRSLHLSVPLLPTARYPVCSWHKTAGGMCTSAQSIKCSANILPRGVGDSDTRYAVKRIIEMAEQVSSRKEVLHTNFLTPPVLKESMEVLQKLVNVKALAFGGYPQAERCRLSVGHPDILMPDSDIVSALCITGNFGFQPTSHSDFLGSIIGTGIAREKLGDIILQAEKGAQVLIVPELADFIISTLDKVGKVSVCCTKIPLDALQYEPPRTKTLKTVETSVRLDALASAGLKISRSKLVNLISDGDVRVNWKTVTKNGTTLQPGDIVSVSGMGRLKIGEISTTKKGKYAVELIRYL